MTGLTHFAPGGYAYLPGSCQFSSAVVAAPGYRIERARFMRPPPLAEGFARIARHLAALDRPTTALCACELRTPEPLSETSFVAFNRAYVEPLAQFGLFRDDANPVARSNLCPTDGSIAAPSMYAFSYTVPAPQGRASFVTSGAAECPDRPNYRAHIVRLGETSPDALRDKLRYALDDTGARLQAMGRGWADVTATRLYSVHDLHFALDEFARRGALAGGGLECHPVLPPVRDFELEVDARAVMTEHVLD